MEHEETDPTNEEREEIRRAYAPLTPEQMRQLQEQYGPPKPPPSPPATFEREEQRVTRQLIAAYGIEWCRSASYVQRYAGMDSLGIPLTPQIRNWYGPMIAEARKRLPQRRDQ